MPSPLNENEKSSFQHCLAMYKQLHTIYPEEHAHLKCQIEALIQLGEDEAAELLLDQLQALLISKGLNNDAEQASKIRQHLGERKHANHYYSTPFLHLVSQRLISNVFQQHKRIHIKEGEHLIRFGEHDDQMYIVLSGELAVWSRDHDGKKNLEHILKAGEVIGELAFLDGTARNADVLACSDGTLVAIPAKAILKLFIEDPKVEEALRFEANTRKVQVEMKKNGTLAKLPKHLQRILAKDGVFIENSPLERIYQSGELIEHIDLVSKGYLQFFGEHNDGSSLKLNLLKEGTLIGCSAITPHMEKHYSADVVCMEQVTRIRFPLESMVKVSELNPSAYQTMVSQAVAERSILMQSMRIDINT